MNKKEIESGNKLIADFLDRYKGQKIEDCEDEIVLDIKYDGFSGSEVSRKTRKFTYSDLKYHSSWDWLMPVVEKINKTWEYTDMDGDEFLPGEQIISVIREALGQVMIDAVYENVVDFINWHKVQLKK